MAIIRFPEQNRTIEDPAAIDAFLTPLGVWHEDWDVAGRIGAEATAAQVLSAYAPEIERLNQRGGFVTADVIDVHPHTPNLDAMLAKFSREHTHAEDEVRFIVEGRGIFHVHLETQPIFSIETRAGDLINVPAGTRHWFHLCDERRIRAIRLFRDPAGWAPLYVEGDLSARYEPLCFGPPRPLDASAAPAPHQRLALP